MKTTRLSLAYSLPDCKYKGYIRHVNKDLWPSARCVNSQKSNNHHPGIIHHFEIYYYFAYQFSLNGSVSKTKKGPFLQLASGFEESFS